MEESPTFDSDALRQIMIALAPGLRADVEQMTRVMREMVELERMKRGLDRPGGKLLLSPNADKKSDHDPDLIGSGSITGRQYRCAGWITKNGKLQIGLLPQNQKK
jgi:hypothetical protein